MLLFVEIVRKMQWNFAKKSIKIYPNGYFSYPIGYGCPIDDLRIFPTVGKGRGHALSEFPLPSGGEAGDCESRGVGRCRIPAELPMLSLMILAARAINHLASWKKKGRLEVSPSGRKF